MHSIRDRNSGTLEQQRVRGDTARAIHRGRRRRITAEILIVALVALVCATLPKAPWTAIARADDLSDLMNLPSDQLENLDQADEPAARSRGADPCLEKLPVPQLKSGLHRVIQLVNCSNEAVLGTANAAQQLGSNPVSVMPREGTWLMKPAGAPRDGNVLTIDVPLEWEDTKCPSGQKECEGIVGPRFWARTGCRYDLAFDKAQCETGGCGGRYDCSAARLAASVGTTVAEWTFNEPVKNTKGTNYFKDSPDISAVDGANLNMDIQPVGSSPHDPFDKDGGHDIQWLAEQYPLTIHGEDLRSDANCNVADFRLRRSALATGKPYGFVIVNGARNPVGGDSTVACFSNCGRYAYPTPPDKGCDETKDARCFRWKAVCLGDPSKYGTNQPKCTRDSDCQVAAACWDQHDPSSSVDHTCQGRAFVKKPPCPGNVCTYPYGYIDPVTKQQFWSTQPPAGDCKLVSSKIAPYNNNVCIGDDTLHRVMPKAYTWPNDPQVYGGDAPAYRVIFAPGGTKEKITRTSTIPFCDELDEAVYGKAKAKRDCQGPVDYGAIFGIAHPKPVQWACDLDPSGAGDEGVICKWKSDAKIQQTGLRANFNSGGQDLPVNVVPGVQPGDLLLVSISFDSAATPVAPSGWSIVPNADVTSSKNQRTVVWYHIAAKGDPTSLVWNWNQAANPSGGMTAWKGVNSANAFDVPAVTASGVGKIATAPGVTAITANTRLLSVYGAGTANQPSFALPVNDKNAGDETGALKINVGPKGTYYAHLVGDRIQVAKGAISAQSVAISQKDPINTNGPDWTAISIVLRP